MKNKLLSVFLPTIISVAIIITLCCFLGFKSFLQLLLFWFYLSNIHYLSGKFFKCPDYLLPLFSISLLIITLYLSGIFGFLLYGFYFALLFGVIAFIILILNEKLSFWKKFICQPKIIWCYYFLAVLAYVQCLKLGYDVWHVDDIHHWALIIKGMVHYNSINGFYSMSRFYNYTVGSAIWAYFINKLSGQTFSFVITNWSNTLLLSACFIVGLGIFKDNKNAPSLYSIGLLLISFVCFQYSSVLFIIIGTISLILAFVILPFRFRAYNSLVLFILYTLTYVFLLITPNAQGSNYRNLPPDILIFAIPAAALCAYFIRQDISTLIFISPILALTYLMKRPGVYFSVVVGVTVLIHFTIFRYKCLVHFCKTKNIKSISVCVIAFALIVSSLYLPPKIWLLYCQKNKIDNVGFKMERKDITSQIKACFLDNETPKYALTRKNFLNKLKNDNVFEFNFKENGILAFAYKNKTAFNTWLASKVKTIVISYYQVFLTLIILQVFSCILLCIYRRQKMFWILSLFIVLFTFLHACGLLVNYCLMFGDDSEKFVIPAFQRYSAPMLKIFIIEVIFCFIIFFINIRQKFSVLLSTSLIVLLVFVNLLINTPKNVHLNVQKWYDNFNRQRLETHSELFPKDIDLKNKNMVIVGDKSISTSPDYDIVGYLLLHLNNSNSYPFKCSYITYKNKKLINKYDYIWWMGLDSIYFPQDLTNSFLANITHNTNDISNLKYACLFEWNDVSKNYMLKYVWRKHTNLLKNFDFKNQFEFWSHDSKSSIKSNVFNNFVYLPKGKSIISQNIIVRTNHYYKIQANIKGNFGYKPCGSIGNSLYFSNNILPNYIDFYFNSYSNSYDKISIYSRDTTDCTVGPIQFLEIENESYKYYE